MVLAIDDDPDIVILLGEYLAGSGYRVVGARTGENGLQLARALRPDVVTLDVLMPGADGWEILTKLKADPETRDIPIVLLTVVDQKDLGFRLGAADYLLKPFDREELVAALQRAAPFHIGDESSGGCGAMKRVLIIEDVEINTDLLIQLLEDDYELVTAADGAAGIEAAGRTRPDVILMDLSLPVIDGWEATRRLKADPDLRRIPVIALTAHAMRGDEEKALAAGCDDYLTKPIDEDILFKKLHWILGTGR